MTTQKEQDEKTLLDKAWEIHGDECMFGGVFPTFRVGFLAGLKQGREENAMVRHAGFWDGVKMEKEEYQSKLAEFDKFLLDCPQYWVQILKWTVRDSKSPVGAYLITDIREGFGRIFSPGKAKGCVPGLQKDLTGEGCVGLVKANSPAPSEGTDQPDSQGEKKKGE